LRDEHRALGRQCALGGLLGLVEGHAEATGQAEHLAGRTHLRPENGVDLGEHREGEDGLLHAEMLDLPRDQPQVGQLPAHHELRGNAGHLDVADLGDQRYRPGGAGVGLEHVDHVVGNGILHVHQADNV
jgi:hypothetical protein